MLTHLSLFSGIGGLDLAAEWAGFQTVGQCEFADYPTKVLERHWPDVPRWRDIRTLTGGDFYARTGRRTVDIISGGFPCQPFSTAGKRRGKEDDRYLWPEMVRVITELRPTWVVGENVAGIVSMALDDILSDLEREGYATRTFLFPAHAVGAPHRRYRTAIVGYSEHNGLYGPKICGGIGETGNLEQKREKTPCESPGTGRSRSMPLVADTNGQRCGETWDGVERSEERASWGCADLAHSTVDGWARTTRERLSDQPGSPNSRADVADTQCRRSGEEENNQPHRNQKRNDKAQEPSRRTKPCEAGSGGCIISYTTSQGLQNGAKQSLGRSQQEQKSQRSNWWDTEPNVGRVANGVPARVDRLKCLGNAVVPQQFYPIFAAIADIEQGNPN